jgi:hypothetical protein
MATSDDVDMVDATTKVQDPNDYSTLLRTNHSDAFAFSAAEELALRLYDQLRELELQQSLLQVQQTSRPIHKIVHMVALTESSRRV